MSSPDDNETGIPLTQILYPNLFFEEELSANSEGSPPAISSTVRRLVGELAPVMGLLSRPAERSIVLVEADSVPSLIPTCLSHVEFATISDLKEQIPTNRNAEYQPWGWSSSASQVAIDIGVVCLAPYLDVVCDINSRDFLVTNDIVVDWPSSTIASNSQPFSWLCGSASDVETTLDLFRFDGIKSWVIKSNLSQAARNRIVGRDPSLTEPHRRWVEKQIASNGCVAVEPWVERIAECGLQFTVSKPGDDSSDSNPVTFDGAAEMLTDPNGRYCGSLISHDLPPEWIEPAISHCRNLAIEAARLGYFGPVGFDCMLFKSPVSGNLQVRLCHDVNARHTMGRVALCLRRWLNPGERGLWLHAAESRWRTALETPNSDSVNANDVNESTIQGVRIVPTSPARVGSQPTQLKTALLISTDRTKLRTVAERILWQTSGS